MWRGTRPTAPPARPRFVRAYTYLSRNGRITAASKEGDLHPSADDYYVKPISPSGGHGRGHRLALQNRAAARHVPITVKYRAMPPRAKSCQKRARFRCWEGIRLRAAGAQQLRSSCAERRVAAPLEARSAAGGGGVQGRPIRAIIEPAILALSFSSS